MIERIVARAQLARAALSVAAEPLAKAELSAFYEVGCGNVRARRCGVAAKRRWRRRSPHAPRRPQFARSRAKPLRETLCATLLRGILSAVRKHARRIEFRSAA